MSKNIYDIKSEKPYYLSRAKIDLFLECPRCFYLEARLGVSRPAGFPFTLNQAVDTLLKREFDILRKKKKAYHLMEKYNIEAIPFDHEKIDEWRNNKIGIQYLHKPTNFLVFGAIDDLWINKNQELHIVDYKTTSTSKEITLDTDYREGYKKQIEVYQWLFRQNGFKVSDIAYFVYCNGKTDRDIFDGLLEFDIQIIEYKGDDSWVEPKLFEIKECLARENIPPLNPECKFCQYRQKAKKIER